MTSAIKAFGTLLKVGDGATPEVFTTVAEVTALNGPSLSQDTVDVTSHSSTGGWAEHVATIIRAGEIGLEVNFVPTDDTQDAVAGLINDLEGQTLRNFQLVWPDSGSTTWSFAAYVTKFEPSAPVGGGLTASCTLLISGQPTLA